MVQTIPNPEGLFARLSRAGSLLGFILAALVLGGTALVSSGALSQRVATIEQREQLDDGTLDKVRDDVAYIRGRIDGMPPRPTP